MAISATLVSLLESRKFWTGTITVAAIVGAVALRIAGTIPADALSTTIGSITAVGLGIIGSIAWEDAASKGAGGQLAPPPAPAVKDAVTVNVAPAQASEPVVSIVPPPAA